MARLTIKGVSKAFGASFAVRDFSLDVDDGELVCLLGPSGSGKSTLLRMIGGFERPSAGAILIDSKDVTTLAPEKRPTGMVFQSHALWTHMDVFNNIAFGLKIRRLAKPEIRERVEGALALVGLSNYAKRMTTELSGGQQQRVALARSLVLEPKILLLDEPFASLDQHLRERLREEVRDIQQRLGITTLFVTHGQDEALTLADRIVVMRDGGTEQIGPPDLIYREPKTEFVAGFIGSMNFVRLKIRNGISKHPDLSLAVPVEDGDLVLAFRPEALALSPSKKSGAGIVHRSIDFGTHRIIDVDLADGTRLKAMTSPDVDWKRGFLVEPVVTAYFAFRDNKLVHRSDCAGEPQTDRMLGHV
ncbi:putative spermidine/putrescine transport system ATP-binding protein [Rhizobium azibense]|uniref:Putative spermidine/putrescine transport system ATP-binding protein n=1 Tax=Rhizobium azibense TaxID=1136135 RepID=A0A4R3QT92_9HYPH|nr:ABC transporter ATP-binding protein [Rhizobium azibense]TCU24447.1 putative spermidine/putrescine transport system ATP-binding protein [Rhizobium azibense]TCU39193.1 putative spermidine/putrescine transport system ATP-binding protein [Rhizobium azibense]